VFGGPTVWEEYKRAWNRALREVNTTLLHETEGGLGGGDESTILIDSSTGKTTANDVGVDAINEVARQEEQALAILDTEKDTTSMTSSDVVNVSHNMKGNADEVADAVSHSSPVVDEGGEGKSAESTKRESVANIDVEIDFEVRVYSCFLLCNCCSRTFIAHSVLSFSYSCIASGG
jgi:hypothetical protein